MVSRRTVLVSLLSAAAALGQSYHLKGRVLDKVGMQPVPGAVVEVAGTGPQAITDSAGRFTLIGPAGIGPARVEASAAPYFRGGALFVKAGRTGQDARVEWFGLTGESVSVADYALPKAGWNRLEVLPGLHGDFLGFVRVTTAGGESHVKRVLRLGDPSGLQWSGDAVAASARTLAKAAAGGQVEVSAAGLATKTVSFQADDADLGDIVLEYPARKLDVGAPPIYGARVLFDGTKGKAAAEVELQAKWQDWPRFTPSAVMFKIAKDPEFPEDSSRVTLQTCCEILWGYDDIQAKAVHGDAQIHVEWIGMGEYDQTENPNTGASALKTPGYINSGVYIQSRYEIQIESKGVSDAKHTMGSLVDDFAADSLTMDRGNGKWQAYDATFRTARYGTGGSKLENARISVWWNGRLVHDNRDAKAPATGIGSDKHSGEELNPTLYGLKLQSEGRDVRFRNVWIKDLTITDPQTNFGY